MKTNFPKKLSANAIGAIAIILALTSAQPAETTTSSKSWQGDSSEETLLNEAYVGKQSDLHESFFDTMESLQASSSSNATTYQTQRGGGFLQRLISILFNLLRQLGIG